MQVLSSALRASVLLLERETKFHTQIKKKQYKGVYKILNTHHVTVGDYFNPLVALLTFRDISSPTSTFITSRLVSFSSTLPTRL
jgi:hypothetical protein